MDDEAALRALNVEIGEAAWLQARLAPVLAFQRASGVVTDGLGFLQAVAKGGDRTTKVETVTVMGNRAIVTSVVTVENGAKSYDNVRPFVRRESAPEGWLLLGWANAPKAWSPTK